MYYKNSMFKMNILVVKEMAALAHFGIKKLLLKNQ